MACCSACCSWCIDYGVEVGREEERDEMEAEWRRKRERGKIGGHDNSQTNRVNSKQRRRNIFSVLIWWRGKEI